MKNNRLEYLYKRSKELYGVQDALFDAYKAAHDAEQYNLAIQLDFILKEFIEEVNAELKRITLELELD